MRGSKTQRHNHAIVCESAPDPRVHGIDINHRSGANINDEWFPKGPKPPEVARFLVTTKQPPKLRTFVRTKG